VGEGVPILRRWCRGSKQQTGGAIAATQTALGELLGVLATAADNLEKSLPFYQEIMEFLQRQEQ